MRTTITYADVVTKQAVEDWAEVRGFSAEEQLSMHFEERFERFGASSIHITAAEDQGECLILQLTTDRWEEPKEFALLSDGSLSW